MSAWQSQARIFFSNSVGKLKTPGNMLTASVWSCGAVVCATRSEQEVAGRISDFSKGRLVVQQAHTTSLSGVVSSLVPAQRGRRPHFGSSLCESGHVSSNSQR